MSQAQGTGPLRVTGHHSPTATADQIAEIANKIHGEVQAANIPTADIAKTDKLLADLQAKYRDFTASFPLVLRVMVQQRLYRESAFRRFLTYYAQAEKKNARQFLETQGEYLVYMHKETTPHYDEGKLREYRQQINKSLNEDQDEFEKAQKEAEEELKEQGKERDRRRRAVVMEQVLARRERAAAAATAATASSASPAASAPPPVTAAPAASVAAGGESGRP